MASEESRLIVTITHDAQRSLGRIWEDNASKKGERQANLYVAFLLSRIKELRSIHHLGRPIGDDSGRRYINAKKRPKGSGHVIVYRLNEPYVEVLDLFHTSRDWQKLVTLEDEFGE